jgi:hypothetical protein
MIDGRPVRRPRFAEGTKWLDWPLNTPKPDDIVAVEVYRHMTEVPEKLRRAADEVFHGQRVPDLPSITGGERVQQDFIPQTCGIINFCPRAGGRAPSWFRTRFDGVRALERNQGPEAEAPSPFPWAVLTAGGLIHERPEPFSALLVQVLR